MIKSKLVIGLSSLRIEEQTSLKKYLLMESTKKSDHYRLLHHLCNSISNLEELLDKDQFRLSYFPGMSKKGFLNLCSRVFQIFEEWLVWYEMKKDRDKCDVLLLKTYNRRGIFNLADKKFNVLNKRLSDTKGLSITHKKNLYEMGHYHHFSENNAKSVIGGNLLENTVSNFLQSYKEQATLYLLEMTNWGKATGYDYTRPIEKILKSVNGITDSKTSILVQKLYQSRIENSNSPLQEVLHNLVNKKVEIGSDLETLVTLYGISISTNNWHKGTLKDPKQIFDFYNYAFESQILLNLGKIRCLRFVNIISVLVHTQTSKKCYEFIDRWCHLIGDQDIESAKNLCYVYAKIKDQQYEDIIYLLRGRKYFDIFTDLRSIAFENIALYKLKEWDILKNRLHNYRRKIRGAKNKISKKVFDSQINFINILELLAKSHFKKVPHIDLNSYSTVFNKAWLQNEIKSRGLG